MRRSVSELSSGLSLEVSPKEALRGAEGLETLAPDTRVFITRLPKGSFEETLAAATRLRQFGLRPVPHITARTTADAATFAKHLERYVREADVREILLVAGSNEKPEGAFSDTLQILQSGVIEASGLTALNVAGHPEGHPQADERELRRALEIKNAFAARTGLPLTIVTQFFFDPDPIVAWEARIRQQGNRLPIDVGLHGVTGVGSLAKHAVACGVGASIKVLGAHSGSVLQFAQIRTPDRLLSGLAAAKARDPASLFRNVHMFPLGGFKRTVAWANAVRNGNYAIGADGQLDVATST